jgi:hypothetical protein
MNLEYEVQRLCNYHGLLAISLALSKITGEQRRANTNEPIKNMPQFTEWETDRSTPFYFFGTTWNVGEAQRILARKQRDNYWLYVADFLGFIINSQNLNPGVQTDLNVPVITVRVGNAWFPIDGWNRIRKAIDTGIEKLPSVRLSGEEDQQIKRQSLIQQNQEQKA